MSCGKLQIINFAFIIWFALFAPFALAEPVKKGYSRFTTYIQSGPFRIIRTINVADECIPKEPSLDQTSALLSQTIEKEPVESSILKEHQTYYISLHPLESEIRRGHYESYSYGGLLLFQPNESGLYRIWVSDGEAWIKSSSLDKNKRKQPSLIPIFEARDDNSTYRRAVQERFEANQKYIIQLNSNVASFHLIILDLKEDESMKCFFWSAKELLDEYHFIFEPK